MMLPGFLLIRFQIIKTEVLKALSQIIVKVLYPCLIFGSITTNFTLRKIIEGWQLPVSIFLIVVLGYFIGLTFTGFFKVKDERLKRSMLFQFTINNYSFLPLAILAKLFSNEYVAALIFSTIGAELMVWTLGMLIINSSKGFSLGNLKNLYSPPLMSIYFSLFVLLVLNLLSTSIKEVLDSSLFFNYGYSTIKQIGEGTVPIAMLMTGGRMATIKWSDLKLSAIWYVTFFRLIVIPLAAIGMIKLLFSDHPYIEVMLVVAIMPTSIISMVFSELYDADFRLMSGTVLITHLIALVSIPIWLYFLI